MRAPSFSVLGDTRLVKIQSLPLKLLNFWLPLREPLSRSLLLIYPVFRVRRRVLNCLKLRGVVYFFEKNSIDDQGFDHG